MAQNNTSLSYHMGLFAVPGILIKYLILKGHLNPINSVAFHALFPILATARVDSTVKLWLLDAEGIAVDFTEETRRLFFPQIAGNL